MVTGDVAALAGIDTGFITHIEGVYGSPAWLPKWSWCRDTHTDGRRIAAALLGANDGRLAMHNWLGEVRISWDRCWPPRGRTARPRPAVTSA